MDRRDLRSELDSTIRSRDAKAKQRGEILQFCCPRHDDRKPSAWLGDHRWGCAACGLEEPLDTLAEELGIDAPRRDFTLEDYAQLKGFILDKLRGWGVETVEDNWGHRVVAFPCRSPDGALVRRKFRSETGTWWEGKHQPTYPYGLDTLAKVPVGMPVILTEGESDVHACWHHQQAAVGIPGASTWKSNWAEFFTGRTVYIWKEPDNGGDTFIERIGRDLPDALVLSPDGFKDLADLHRRGDFEETLERLMDAAQPIRRPTDKDLPLVMPVSQFLAESDEDSAGDFLIPGMLVKGDVGGITGRPKAGKTTWMLHAVDAISQGVPFMGMDTRPARVLWINLEMPRKLLRWKIRHLGTTPPPFDIIPWATRDTLDANVIGNLVVAGRYEFVNIDSLSKYWQISEENSSRDVEEALNPLLQMVQTTECGLAFVHHSQKARTPGMSVMDCFRGSGNIGGTIGLGLLVSKCDVEGVRKIEVEGRYDDVPELLYARLVDGRYEAVEDPGAVQQEEEQAAVLRVLTTNERKLKEIEAALTGIGSDLRGNTLRDRLGALVAAGQAVQGKDGNAHTWKRAA